MSIINKDLYFYDCNAFIGAHVNPYAPSPFEADILKSVIKSTGTIGALVYNSAAVVYDASFGNNLLIEKIKGNNELKPVFIAAPELCFTQIEAEKYYLQLKVNKIRAVKIFPRYNNFDISTGVMDRLFPFLNEEKIILLANQVEITWHEIEYVLSKFDNLPFLLQSSGYRLERLINPFFASYKNFYLDISRFHVHGGIEYLCREFGSERVLYGSGMPVFSPEPIMAMISEAEISPEEKQNISSKNLLRLISRE